MPGMSNNINKKKITAYKPQSEDDDSEIEFDFGNSGTKEGTMSIKDMLLSGKKINYSDKFGNNDKLSQNDLSSNKR